MDDDDDPFDDGMDGGDDDDDDETYLQYFRFTLRFYQLLLEIFSN